MNGIVEFKLSGRSGELVYSRDGKSVRVYVEISGSEEFDFLVDFDQVDSWSSGEPISPEELKEIKCELISWASNTGTKCQW